eukprot:TRINITY_DN14980_c0_g1_i1.p1 TRINITY_DN14980_c0_g1~~TRINITY_DN14980_c0_g1_i1.p1  ORF type:complete len:131 (-),score=16.12 TRINITY_DN14980_c0_g1_i1:46-438(-)
MVKSNYGPSMAPTSLTIRIPCHPNVAKISMRLSKGSFKHDAKSNTIIWTIPNFFGKMTHSLQGESELLLRAGDRGPWVKQPIFVKFTLPKYTVSGLRIRFVKVLEKSGYHTESTVNYTTKCEEYEVRTHY